MANNQDSIRKKKYDRVRYAKQKTIKLDVGDDDVEVKTYNRRISSQRMSEIGMERAHLAQQRKFDRYFKAWCEKNDRMHDYEIFKLKDKGAKK